MSGKAPERRIAAKPQVLFVVGFFQAFSASPGHEPDVIEQQEREGRVSPFKVATIKAYCAVNNDSANNCELNYSKGLFHVCSSTIEG